MLKTRRGTLVGISLAMYLIVVSFTLLGMWRGAEHLLVYVLDDAYIHLALATRIAHGHYGINVAEYSSPSSSILWPFLLAPFSRTGFATYTPLLLNLVAGCFSATIIAAGVSRFRRNDTASGSPTSLVWSTVSIAGLMLMSNLVGLTILGMEHSLQIALALACAYGIMCALQGVPMPVWCLAAAALAPSVRYEGLALTMAVAVALLAMKQWRRALLVVSVAVIPLIAFSLFLHSLGLPVIPLSVMVKGGVPATTRSGVFQSAKHTIMGNLGADFTDPTRWPLLLMLVGLLWYVARSREPIRRLTLAGVSAALTLHLLVGQFGWFFRYEVYISAFSGFILLALLHEHPDLPPLPWYLFGIAALASGYIAPIRAAAGASSGIYTEQYQMARFAQQYYTGNVAINDLGLVSYGMPPSRYVYDIWGLGTPSVATHQVTSFSDDMARHHVGLAIIYKGATQPVASWQPLGTMCTEASVYVFVKCVDFYSVNPSENSFLEDQFQRFRKTVPQSVTFRPLER
jgi:hypothetical protein